jgi:hypothetical protein
MNGRNPSRPLPPGMRGRAAWIGLLAIGGVLVAAAAALSVVPFSNGTVPQWNGLCHGDLGRLGQLLSPAAHGDCARIATADHLIGWLLGLGIAVLLAGALLAAAQLRRPGVPPAGEPLPGTGYRHF